MKRGRPDGARLRYVYVRQYGSWWRLTGAQWRAIALEALCPGPGYDGYSLPGTVLKRRPRGLLAVRSPSADEDEPGWNYFPRRACDSFVEPLDWDRDDFRECAEDRGWWVDDAEEGGAIGSRPG